MFEQTFVEGRGKTNTGWTVFLSFGLQIGLITALVIIPLLNPELLPQTTLKSMLTAPPPPPPQPLAPANAVLAMARHLQQPPRRAQQQGQQQQRTIDEIHPAIVLAGRRRTNRQL